MAFQTKKESEITHKQIVFETIKDLERKAAIEYKSNLKKEVDMGNRIQIIDLPDSRKEFIQLVEFLSDLLFAEFDVGTKKIYEGIMKEVEESAKKFNEEQNSTQSQRTIYANNKLEIMRKLFRAIMCFLKKNDYLKSSSYSEDDFDDDEES